MEGNKKKNKFVTHNKKFGNTEWHYAGYFDQNLTGDGIAESDEGRYKGYFENGNICLGEMVVHNSGQKQIGLFKDNPSNDFERGIIYYPNNVIDKGDFNGKGYLSKGTRITGNGEVHTGIFNGKNIKEGSIERTAEGGGDLDKVVSKGIFNKDNTLIQGQTCSQRLFLARKTKSSTLMQYNFHRTGKISFEQLNQFDDTVKNISGEVKKMEDVVQNKVEKYLTTLGNRIESDRRPNLIIHIEKVEGGELRLMENVSTPINISNLSHNVINTSSNINNNLSDTDSVRTLSSIQGSSISR